MVRNTRRLGLFVFMLVSLVTLAQREGLAWFQCGPWGTGYSCVWSYDYSCEYWEYNCQNMCPGEPSFNCIEEYPGSSSGSCGCDQ